MARCKQQRRATAAAPAALQLRGRVGAAPAKVFSCHELLNEGAPALGPASLQADGAAAAMKQLIALGRVGAPEEAAGAMLLLASPYASYVTGQALEVTGGGWL